MAKSIFALLVLATATNVSLGLYKDVKLKDSGYEGIVIAINPEIEENPDLIENLKNIWTNASKALWRATDYQVYFKNITILVPNTWANGIYATASKQTYDNADVLVANAHPNFGDEPYTLQYGQCGEPGQYIHLTPNYILDELNVSQNYGPKGKTIVHEWAHLRWGVFDESATQGYDPFYYKDGTIEATRCPAALKGKNFFPYGAAENEGEECYIDESTGFPVDGCVFILNNTQDANLKASLMSHQFVEEVVTFCHDDPKDLVNLHNVDAPNEQNRLCDQRSVWDVINSSPDFLYISRKKNVSEDLVNPTFQVVQVKAFKRFVLVLDSSGSMGSDNKRENMLTAANLFITEYAPTGSEVGIVDFDSDSFTVSELTVLENDGDRARLASNLPSIDAAGGTCIACGILEGIQVLNNGAVSDVSGSGDGLNDNSAGGAMLLLTDGLDGSQAHLSEEAYAALLSNNTVLSTIFFGVEEGNLGLQEISEESGGSWSFDTDLKSLIESFNDFGKDDSGDVFNFNFQVHSQSYPYGESTIEGDVSIDSSIGKKTVFTFTWSEYSSPDVTLISPNGSLYCSNATVSLCPNGLGYVDEYFKTITFQIPGKAEVGKWTYTVSPNNLQSITVVVSSMAADRSFEPIVAESGISATDIGDLTALVVYARVTKGFSPVLAARVEATVTHPSAFSEKILLFDAGAAPDIRKDDGVYSRYFTNYTAHGRYSVQVTVTGSGNATGTTNITRSKSGSGASFNYGSVQSDGTLALNKNSNPTHEAPGAIPAESIDPFQRIQSPGGFSYSGPIPGAEGFADPFPPSQVLDLTAAQVNVDQVSEGFRISFTSAGDDYDAGTAQRYEIRYAYNDTNKLISAFDEQLVLGNDSIVEGNLTIPQSAGTIESFTAVLNDLPFSDDITKVGFAVRAVDKAGNLGKVSNVALLDVFVVPLAITATTATSLLSTSTETTTSQVIETMAESREDLFRLLTLIFACLSFVLLCVLISATVLCQKKINMMKKMNRMMEEDRETSLDQYDYRIRGNPMKNRAYVPDPLFNSQI